MSADGRRPPMPFEVIAEALDEPAGRATFMRGLMLGALVGAAVVGSVLRARQARRRPRPVMVVTGTAVEPGAEPGAVPSAGFPEGTADADGMDQPGAETGV